MAETLKEHLTKRKKALENERQSWMSHWREISEWVLPRRGRFTLTDRNYGGKRNGKIIDSTGTFALRTLTAGLTSGASSPARPWFRLSTWDPSMAEFAPVKFWLSDVQRILLAIFNKSNTYTVLPATYEELGAFGTGACIGVEDIDDVVRLYPMTAGQYSVAQSPRLMVDTLYREIPMTVGQVVAQFGENAVSRTTKALWDRGATESWLTVNHAIEPNIGYDSTRRDARNKPWRSIYWEDGSDSLEGVLSEGGFEELPCAVPRWNLTSSDIYGTSPAMDVLGDVKQLQTQEKRKAQAIDKHVDPPMTAPGSLRNQPASVLPGGVTYVDVMQGQQGFKPTYEVRPILNELLQDMQETRARIERAFYSDLFLMLARSDRRQMTATEVAERHEEKLLMLGPVTERLHGELFSVIIDRTFAIANRRGLMPPAPQELQEQPLKVEFVSLLAQAQKLVGVASVDRIIGFVGNAAGVKPDIVDKLDWDQAVDEYGDMLGLPAGIIRADDAVKVVRKERKQAQAAANAAALAQQGGRAVRDLGSVKTEERNLVSDFLSNQQAA